MADDDARQVEIVPAGDSAALVRLGHRIDRTLNDRVHALAERITAERDRDRRWLRPVPAYASVFVPYDALAMSWDEARAHLSAMATDASRDEAPSEPPLSAEPLDIPVRYGGSDGPDLDEVAERVGLTPAAVIELHAGRAYRVYMLGFSPGFAYLGALDERLRLPRRATPRTHVPERSVAIAEAQTAVYPSATPGGWHLIGRTELRPWDVRRDPPALLAPGRTVRFRPVAA